MAARVDLRPLAMPIGAVRRSLRERYLISKFNSLTQSKLARVRATYPLLPLPSADLLIVSSLDGLELATEAKRAAQQRNMRCCLVAADFFTEDVDYAHRLDSALLCTIAASVQARRGLVVGHCECHRVVQGEPWICTWRLTSISSCPPRGPTHDLAHYRPFLTAAAAGDVGVVFERRNTGMLVVGFRSPKAVKIARAELNELTLLAGRHPSVRFIWFNAARSGRMLNLVMTEESDVWDRIDYLCVKPRDCVYALHALCRGIRIVCSAPIGLPQLHSQVDGAPLCTQASLNILLKNNLSINLRRPCDVALARHLALDALPCIPGDDHDHDHGYTNLATP